MRNITINTINFNLTIVDCIIFIQNRTIVRVNFLLGLIYILIRK